MSQKKRSNEGNELRQGRVAVADTFTASDYIMDNSMDNVEGMLKLLMNNPFNVIKKKYPTDLAQRANVELFSPKQRKLQKKTASIIRALSAESTLKTSRPLMRNSAVDLKTSKNIRPRTSSSSSTITPYAFVIGPVRVQTTQKINGKLAGKLFIDELLELYGSGMKYPSEKLINIKPKILKSLSAMTQDTPTTVQSVGIGHNYIRIDRKTELWRPGNKQQPVTNAKELVEFGGGIVQEKQRADDNRHGVRFPTQINRSRKVKSEAALNGIPVFNLIGPLVITAFQNTIHNVRGGYKIYEEIELRTDESTAKPEISVTPFLRKVSESPRHGEQQTTLKYQEDILVGHNVMLIKRLIEIGPPTKKIEGFSLSEERNYVTDKTAGTTVTSTKSITSSTRKKPKMLVLQESPTRTDHTASDLSFESAKQQMHHPATASSDRGIVETSNKFRMVHQPSTSNRLGGIEVMKKNKLTAPKTPTEAFMSADLLTARTPSSKSSAEKPIFEDALKPSRSSRYLWTRKPLLLEAVNSDSKLQGVLSAMSPPARTARSFIRSPHDPPSPRVDPLTPSRSPKTRRRKSRTGSMEDCELRTASRPEDFTFSSDHSSESHSSEEEERRTVPKESAQIPSSLYTLSGSSLSGKKTRLLSTAERTFCEGARKDSSDVTTTNGLSKGTLRATCSRFQRFSQDRKEAGLYSTAGRESSLATAKKFSLRRNKLPLPTSNIKSSVIQQHRSTENQQQQLLKAGSAGIPAEATMLQFCSRSLVNKQQSKLPKEILTDIGRTARALDKVRSRFQRFPQRRKFSEFESKDHSSMTTRSQSKKQHSATSATQISEDTKSSEERTPSNLSHFVVTVPSEISIFSKQSKTPKGRCASEPQSNLTNTALSTVVGTATKKTAEVSRSEQTSVVIQSKDEYNLTMQLNINFRIKNVKTAQDGRHNLKPKNILIDGRKVYEKCGINYL